jgi:hypothetical protein
MRRRILGLGLGLALGMVGAGAIPATAFADSTCYIECAPPTAGGGGSSSPVGVTAEPVTPVTAGSSGSALAFTGADIEELTLMGVGAMAVGGLLFGYSRKRRTTAAS